MSEIFEYVEGSFGGNSIEGTFHNGMVSIRIENPFAGDTESGFGETCYVSMPAAQAHEFGKWLLSLTAGAGQSTKRK